MKTANVKNILIQMDIPDNVSKEKEVEYVNSIITLMNNIIGMSELESQPQIMAGGAGIDSADIYTEDSNIEDED